MYSVVVAYRPRISWWRHQMETFPALLALCAVTGEFPTQRPVTRNFDVFFDLRLNKRLIKQSWGWWSETPSCSLWRHCNVRRLVTFSVTHYLHWLRWTWTWREFGYVVLDLISTQIWYFVAWWKGWHTCVCGLPTTFQRYMCLYLPLDWRSIVYIYFVWAVVVYAEKQLRL